ncbi:MAG: hypothetical protein KJO90_03165 [Eudoraea sp.]|nr:hypothetical protein [Eudoraea sp.]
MKNWIAGSGLMLLVILFSASGCGSSQNSLEISEDEALAFKNQEADTVAITDPDSNYEIIIIEPGFNFWLASIARPRGHYSQTFLENRNRLYVVQWNNRVLQPNRFDPLLYQLQINYSPQIDYGYEVNYKLYNYFIFFQRRYRTRLGPFIPRI